MKDTVMTREVTTTPLPKTTSTVAIPTEHIAIISGLGAAVVLVLIGIVIYKIRKGRWFKPKLETVKYENKIREQSVVFRDRNTWNIAKSPSSTLLFFIARFLIWDLEHSADVRFPLFVPDKWSNRFAQIKPKSEDSLKMYCVLTSGNSKRAFDSL